MEWLRDIVETEGLSYEVIAGMEQKWDCLKSMDLEEISFGGDIIGMENGILK